MDEESNEIMILAEYFALLNIWYSLAFTTELVEKNTLEKAKPRKIAPLKKKPEGPKRAKRDTNVSGKKGESDTHQGFPQGNLRRRPRSQYLAT